MATPTSLNRSTLAIRSGQNMTNLILPRVPPDEAVPFYAGVLAAFPDGRVGMHLQAQVKEFTELCAGLSESDAMFQYALLRERYRYLRFKRYLCRLIDGRRAEPARARPRLHVTCRDLYRGKCTTSCRPRTAVHGIS